MAHHNLKRDLVYVHLFTGLGDGLIVPFIVGILTLSLTNQPARSLILLSVAAVIGGLAFALARYFGELTEIEHHHPELSAPDAARELAMIEYLDIASEVAVEMREEMAAEKAAWLQEMKEHELDWESLNKRRAVKGSIQTGLSFLSGGLITLLLFSFALTMVASRFSLSFFLATALPLLFLIGLIGGWKAAFTGRPFYKGVIFSFLYGIFSLSMPSLIAWILMP